MSRTIYALQNTAQVRLPIQVLCMMADINTLSETSVKLITVPPNKAIVFTDIVFIGQNLNHLTVDGTIALQVAGVTYVTLNIKGDIFGNADLSGDKSGSQGHANGSAKFAGAMISGGPGQTISLSITKPTATACTLGLMATGFVMDANR